MATDDDTTDEPMLEFTSELYASCVEPEYWFNRDRAQKDREQIPVFLRDEVRYAFNDVHNTLSAGFDDKIHKADTGELLVMLALRHLEELPEVAADIGIGVSFDEASDRRRE
jgi:hypothetical protein